MLISFQLTMPNKGSWNGQWSGKGRPYFIVKNISKRFFDKQEHFKKLKETGKDSWYYRWDDGWGASIIAEIVPASEANKRRRASVGFCGYDWMVESIMYEGKIMTRTERGVKQETITIGGKEIPVSSS